ncbi:MAG TPA: hypothetical protein VL068_11690 [Microthrixaceae bacterium]|nr:hypothetical protein [Microthrixaceae bacterium]
MTTKALSGLAAPRSLLRHQKKLGAVVSQSISSLSSLLLAAIAARELGAEGLGAFAILFSIVITFNALTSGYVGDSLTVLDRFDPDIRRALLAAAVTSTILAIITAWASALALGLGAGATLAFAGALTAWVWEEYFRRLLINIHEFWKLAINDAAFLLTALASIGVLHSFDRLTLSTLFLAMILGSTSCVVLATFQLPTIELALPERGSIAVRKLNSFAIWRAAQTAIRSLSMSVVRIAVALVATTAAVGDLEAARILATPMTTVVAGAAAFILPRMAAEERGEAGARQTPVVKVSLLLGGVSLVIGIICTLLVPTIAAPILGDRVAVDQLAALHWALFASAFGLGVPLGNALVAMKQSRLTFWIRLLDAVLGVSLATLLAWAISPSWTPLGLTIGALIGAGCCFIALRREGRI